MRIAPELDAAQDATQDPALTPGPVDPL